MHFYSEAQRLDFIPEVKSFFPSLYVCPVLINETTDKACFEVSKDLLGAPGLTF